MCSNDSGLKRFSKDMRLSVIVVNYNAARFLERCLSSLEATLQAISHEVCVVDNASTDGSADLIRRQFPGVRLIINEQNLGFAAAINIGLTNTSGEYVLWLNPDSEVLNSGVNELIDYLDLHQSVGVVGARIVDPDGAVQLSCRSFPSYKTALFNRYSVLTRIFPNNRHSSEYLQTAFDHSDVREVDWVSGACLLHRRVLIEQIGRPDERFFMYSEDVDFCLRAKQAGFKVVYHPGMQVLHHIGGSSRQLRRRCIRERHRSMWLYYSKHFGRNILKDLIVTGAIWCRCAVLIFNERIKSEYQKLKLEKEVLSDER
jgi:N-acetylglucosaminyl-diphospho-decaprenol L-rhamnosyltransferase